MGNHDMNHTYWRTICFFVYSYDLGRLEIGLKKMMIHLIS